MGMGAGEKASAAHIVNRSDDGYQSRTSRQSEELRQADLNMIWSDHAHIGSCHD